MSAMTEMEWLTDWYRRQVDGDWEHQYGITIATLDNPGWSLRIDLEGTALRDTPFAVEAVNEEETWWRCWKDDGPGVFHGAGDPNSLAVILRRFREWASEATITGR